MPSRIIKESICTSDNIDQLSAFQETMFYRLIVNCDDYGRMDGRPKILAAKLFPLKDIRTTQIEDALRALTSAELVTRYVVDGKPFLQMKTWERHQQIRAKKSKYPAPESGVNESDINCNQMISDDSRCPRNPIQYETESESNTNSASACADAPTEKKDKRFQKPTSDDIRAYCQENSISNVVPEAFIDHYEANGWKIGGRTPMKDWKAAVRNWARNDYGKGNAQKKTVTVQQFPQRQYADKQLEDECYGNFFETAGLK